MDDFNNQQGYDPNMYQQPQGGYDPNAYQQSQYNQNAYQQPQQQGSGLGIASMVCGIVALVGSCFGWVGIILAIIAVVLGALGIKKNSGKGMAIAGLVCGIIALVPSIIVLTTAASIYSALLSL